jgi:peptidoglycan hydrolase-like protein with peptidoglycan-binding domain
MKNNILNEIETMKYLLGYKRGVVISEQVTPASTTAPVATTTATTAPVATTTATTAPVTAGTTTDVVKMGVVNPKVKELQELLNTKFNSGLVPDGKYGPKTSKAIMNNIQTILALKKPAETLNTMTKPMVQQPPQLQTNLNIPRQQ